MGGQKNGQTNKPLFWITGNIGPNLIFLPPIFLPIIIFLHRYTVIFENRSCVRRFSDSEFAQFVRICFCGGEQCGHDNAAFGV